LDGWVFRDDGKIKVQQKGLKISSLILILPPVLFIHLCPIVNLNSK